MAMQGFNTAFSMSEEDHNMPKKYCYIGILE